MALLRRDVLKGLNADQSAASQESLGDGDIRTPTSLAWLLGGVAALLSAYTFLVWAQYPVPGAGKGGHVQLMTFLYLFTWSCGAPCAAVAYLAVSIQQPAALKHHQAGSNARVARFGRYDVTLPTPVEACAGAVLFAAVGALLTFGAAPNLLRTAVSGYRIGDVVAGKMSGGPMGYWGLRTTYALAFPNTIAYEYLQITDEPWRIDVLAAITTRRAAKLHASNGGARKMGGGGDSLVVHLRLGDVLGQTHFYGGFDLMKTDSTPYIKNVSYYARAFKDLPRDLSHVTVVGDYRHTSGVPHAIGESIRYRRQVEDYFRSKLRGRPTSTSTRNGASAGDHHDARPSGAHGRQRGHDQDQGGTVGGRGAGGRGDTIHGLTSVTIDRRYEHEPDDDIIFMTSASHFCVGGGGFSMVVAKVARQRGAKLVCGVGTCWPPGTCTS